MNKTDLLELIERTEAFDDEIEIRILDSENVPVEIKHVDWMIDEEGNGMIVIVPMGAHIPKDTQKSVRIWPRD